MLANQRRETAGIKDCWMLTWAPGRQTLALGRFMNLKIFWMLLPCCIAWFSDQKECHEGTVFLLMCSVLQRSPACAGGGWSLLSRAGQTDSIQTLTTRTDICSV